MRLVIASNPPPETPPLRTPVRATKAWNASIMAVIFMIVAKPLSIVSGFMKLNTPIKTVKDNMANVIEPRIFCN